MSAKPKGKRPTRQELRRRAAALGVRNAHHRSARALRRLIDQRNGV